MYTRREFGKIATAAMSTTALRGAPLDATVNGVKLGIITYDFRDLPHTPGVDYIDSVVKACETCGAGEIEVMSRLTVQPPELTSREDVRKWRTSAPPEFFAGIPKKFEAAGMHVFSYTNTLSEDFTDEELDKTFAAGKAMGVEYIGFTMGRLSAVPRIVPHAEKYYLKVCFHNSPAPNDPGLVSSPETFEKAVAMSPLFRINLDIGHFTAANFDAVATLRQMHDKISHIHLKDRKKGINGGANLEWGQGDSPIREVLTMVRDNKWPLRCIAEYEYQGKGTSVEETKKCLDYARRALA